MDATDDLDPRLARIRESRGIAEAHVRRMRTRDSRAIMVGLVAGTLATVISGVPGVTQVFILDGWQVTCAVTAGLTGMATIAAGLRQQYGSSTQLLGAATLVAKLRGLEFDLEVGRIGPDEADKEFRGLIEQYPELLPPRVVHGRAAPHG